MNDAIQSVERTFHILEEISRTPNTPHRVQEVAHSANLPVPTVSKILRTLTTLGYLENVGRKQGYVLGLKTMMLSERYNDGDELRQLCRKPLEKYFQEFGEYVDLCTLRYPFKRIVFRIRGAKADPRNALRYPQEEEPLRSLSGLILISFLPEDKQLFSYRRKKLSPVEHFSSEAGYLARLKEISGLPYLTARCNTDQFAIALPVHLPDGSKAALGSFMRRENYRPEMVDRLREIAAELVRKY